MQIPIIAALNVTVESHSVSCGQADASLRMWKRLAEHSWTAGDWTLVRFISAAHERKKNAHMSWLCNTHRVLHACWAIMLYIYKYFRSSEFKSCVLISWKHKFLTWQPLKNNLKLWNAWWKDEVNGYLEFRVTSEGHAVCVACEKQSEVHLRKITGLQGLLNNTNTNWILIVHTSHRRQGSHLLF